jgi:hypothetical protein
VFFSYSQTKIEIEERGLVEINNHTLNLQEPKTDTNRQSALFCFLSHFSLIVFEHQGMTTAAALSSYYCSSSLFAFLKPSRAFLFERVADSLLHLLIE